MCVAHLNNILYINNFV